MKLWEKISLLTTSVLLVTTGVTGGIVVHRTVQYNETKTVENYEQQLHATAYALGKEISDSELEGYTEATRSSFYNYILKKYGASKYILIKDGEVVCNLTAFDLVNPREERWAGTEASADIRQVGEQHLLILGKNCPRIPFRTTGLSWCRTLRSFMRIWKTGLAVCGDLFCGGSHIGADYFSHNGQAAEAAA